jgi:hypothetical protein
VKLGLLLPAELRALICLMDRRAAVEAARPPLAVRLRAVSTCATCDRDHVVATASQRISRAALPLGLCSAAFLSSSSCASTSSSPTLYERHPSLVHVCSVGCACSRVLVVGKDSSRLLQRIRIMVRSEQVIVCQLVLQSSIFLAARSADKHRRFDLLNQHVLRLA